VESAGDQAAHSQERQARTCWLLPWIDHDPSRRLQAVGRTAGELIALTRSVWVQPHTMGQQGHLLVCHPRTTRSDAPQRTFKLRLDSCPRNQLLFPDGEVVGRARVEQRESGERRRAECAHQTD
jgi:hypothetical protein